jgi:deoxyguanosine kinase
MYIAIEGVIGVGKTTLARMLQPVYDANILLEIFEENPFLSDFYGDRERYAFQTQVFFLLSRYHQQRSGVTEMLSKKQNLISDYTFAKDSLFARVTLKGDELDTYFQVHHALAEKITVPDLIIYLRADTDVLMKRIAARDRSYERQMETAYIAMLNKAYDEYFLTPDVAPAPVLVIETSHMDYVRNEDDFKQIDDRIRQMLKLAPYQQSLLIE